jgi:hypothetical protein
MATIYEMASNYPELKDELLSMYDRFEWAGLKSYVAEYLDFGDTASDEIKSWIRGYILRHENAWYVQHKIPQAIVKETYDLNTFEMTFNGFVEMLSEKFNPLHDAVARYEAEKARKEAEAFWD